jgi:hypothetical protein
VSAIDVTIMAIVVLVIGMPVAIGTAIVVVAIAPIVVPIIGMPVALVTAIIVVAITPFVAIRVLTVLVMFAIVAIAVGRNRTCRERQSEREPETQRHALRDSASHPHGRDPPFDAVPKHRAPRPSLSRRARAPRETTARATGVESLAYAAPRKRVDSHA